MAEQPLDDPLDDAAEMDTGSEEQSPEEDVALATTKEASPQTAAPDVAHVEQHAASPDSSGASKDNLDLLKDVSLEVTVELGRKEMIFGEILQLTKGSLIELNKLADGPVDIYVNRTKIAEGEVVVIDEHFGVRITRILNTSGVSEAE